MTNEEAINHISLSVAVFMNSLDLLFGEAVSNVLFTPEEQEKFIKEAMTRYLVENAKPKPVGFLNHD